MTYRALYADVTARFTAAGLEDAAFDARCILEDVGGMPHGILPPAAAVPTEKVTAVETAVSQRLQGRPLQYILGEWDFLSLRLFVGEGVLIPRQDTEVLCETVASALQETPAPHVVDLCAGSGCVGLGIASLVSDVRVTAVEKSPQAFTYLKKNIARYPALRVTAVQGDILTDHETFTDTYDAIVSNPPYIPAADLSGLMREVQNEPQMALDGGVDGLTFYRAICTRWVPKLKTDGLCAVEIGFDQGEQVYRLFGKAGLTDCRVIQDYCGNDRVVLGYRR